MNNFYMILAVGAVSLFHGQALADSQCPVSPGEQVEFHTAQSFFERLSLTNIEKDEFETTAQFEHRLATAKTIASVSATTLVAGRYSSYETRYDADAEQLALGERSWTGPSLNFIDVYSTKADPNVHPKDIIRSVGLDVNWRDTGTYIGANAFGAALEVQQRESDKFAVFDQTSDSYQADPTWILDTYIDSAYEANKLPALAIPMKVERAKELKKELRVGFAVRPKAPYVLTGDVDTFPKIDDPERTTVHLNIIVADIICGIITTPSGEVLATIAPGYRRADLAQPANKDLEDSQMNLPLNLLTRH